MNAVPCFLPNWPEVLMLPAYIYNHIVEIRFACLRMYLRNAGTVHQSVYLYIPPI
jgi:hypothetical protein